jgi:hypothetical protein
MFDIDIKTSGISADKLKEAILGVTFEGVTKHCDDIKQEAEKCGLTKNELELTVVKGEGDTFIIHENLKNKEKFQCLKQAFEKVLPTIPDGMRAVFEDFLRKLEKKYTT